jgi:benzoate membrane transport protein
MKDHMKTSIITSALVALVVGFGGSVAIVIAAAQAVDADQAQTLSWLTALSLGMMATSALLSYIHKAPMITAWSTPGAALIATAHGFSLAEASGAFLICGGLILATGFVDVLGAMVRKIPTSIATGILAGVLFPFVTKIVTGFQADPLLSIGMIGAFLLLRGVSPSWAVIGSLVVGSAISLLLRGGSFGSGLELSTLNLVRPAFSSEAIFSISLPLYLVTMASQNLPGLAVLRASGYTPTTRSIFSTTGFASILGAFFGAHSIGMAAITASICVGPDSHPDPEKRWQAGLVYALGYGLVALLLPTIYRGLMSMPPTFFFTLAGLALISPMSFALTTLLNERGDILPGMVAFVVTASGVVFMGIGSAFWGLILGALIHLWNALSSGLSGQLLRAEKMRNITRDGTVTRAEPSPPDARK